jgi:hypothetical protein
MLLLLLWKSEKASSHRKVTKLPAFALFVCQLMVAGGWRGDFAVEYNCVCARKVKASLHLTALPLQSQSKVYTDSVWLGPDSEPTACFTIPNKELGEKGDSDRYTPVAKSLFRSR